MTRIRGVKRKDVPGKRIWVGIEGGGWRTGTVVHVNQLTKRRRMRVEFPGTLVA